MNAIVDDKPERAWGAAAVPPTLDTTGVDGEQRRDPPRPGTSPADDVAPDEEPPHRTRRARHSRPERSRPPRAGRLRTSVVLALLLTGIGAGGVHILRERLAAAAFVDLGDVVLTAEAVPVGFAEAVVVTAVAAIQHSRVSRGQELARVTGATGQEEILLAPDDGIVAAVNVAVGGVAKGGEPILMLYDQARLTFTADVPVASLRRLRLGMTATVDGPGLAQPVTATLDHVVPIVGAGPGQIDRLTVVLVPVGADRAMVGSLVPGLPFHAVVDTNSAPGALPAVNTG